MQGQTTFWVLNYLFFCDLCFIFLCAQKDSDISTRNKFKFKLIYPLLVGKSPHQLFGLVLFAPWGSGETEDSVISRPDQRGDGPGESAALSVEDEEQWWEEEALRRSWEPSSLFLVVLILLLEQRHLILELLWLKNGEFTHSGGSCTKHSHAS